MIQTSRRLIGVATALALALGVGAAAAQQQQQKKCFPSVHGKDDQIGNANYVTPAKVLQAVRTITKGKAYALGIETNKDTPAFPPRTFSITVTQPGQQGGGTLGPTKTTYNDDIIAGWVGIGSQLDGLGHIGIDSTYYNCNEAKDFANAGGLTKLGIEKFPAFATRGILLDMAGLMGTDVVKEGTAFNRPEIEAAMRRQGVRSIEQGDVVLFYTGWTKLIGKDNKRYGATISASPESIALRGMPSNFAVAGSCTNTTPPFSLMARNPSVPSEPMPERITPMLCSCRSCARERRKKSIGKRSPRGDAGSSRCSTPCRMDMSLFGGIT